MCTFLPLPSSTFPDISRHNLGKSAGQGPLTKGSMNKFTTSLASSPWHSPPTQSQQSLYSPNSHTFSSHILSDLLIIDLRLKTHQSGRLQRNPHIISCTLNRGKHSPNNHHVLRLWHLVTPEEIQKLCSGSGARGHYLTQGPEAGSCSMLFSLSDRATEMTGHELSVTRVVKNYSSS